MEEIRKHGQVGRAAMKADMDPKTARKYAKLAKLPSELRRPERTWRTRPDPFAEDWPWVEEMLTEAPELEAKTLFEALQTRHPERYHGGQLRTLQRRVKQWRAAKGPDKEVFFPQAHVPGEAMQTDFTHATELGITIAGVAFVHMLCHVVLPYSNWQWLTVCLSESYLALKRGVQTALFRLGRRTVWHQTDNTSAATHQPTTGKRVFNDDYRALMKHLGMKPRTITIGKKEQNGDVEAAHGALKRWLNQHLIMRGSRDFDSVEAYEQWLWSLLDRRNRPEYPQRGGQGQEGGSVVTRGYDGAAAERDATPTHPERRLAASTSTRQVTGFTRSQESRTRVPLGCQTEGLRLEAFRSAMGPQGNGNGLVSVSAKTKATLAALDPPVGAQAHKRLAKRRVACAQLGTQLLARHRAGAVERSDDAFCERAARGAGAPSRSATSRCGAGSVTSSIAKGSGEGAARCSTYKSSSPERWRRYRLLSPQACRSPEPRKAWPGRAKGALLR
ncbi:MAG TPA: IS21 family transposase [Polyangiaceae bacterium]|nr:IS21 family transposase [Polyangiaceae bacterium]